MNYRNEALRQLQELARQHTDYSAGDILFTALQKLALQKGVSLSFLREISDEDFYTQIEKTIKKEEVE